MSNKILVPTDLSSNSAAGIRFAIQLSSQNKRVPVYFNVVELLKPSRWSKETYTAYAERELAHARDRLVKFVHSVYDKAGIKKRNFECVARQGIDAKKGILDYAAQIKARSICMSTRGAGRFEKILGTHTSGILATSPVPVYVVPKRYRIAPLKNFLYASDLERLKGELKKIRDFISPIKATLAVHHYDYLFELESVKKKLARIRQRYSGADLKFVFQKINMDETFPGHLMRQMKKAKASLVILFTYQRKGWFDKLFLPSQSARMAFTTTIPLLVFPKKK